jgi:hypothetical protein
MTKATELTTGRQGHAHDDLLERYRSLQPVVAFAAFPREITALTGAAEAAAADLVIPILVGRARSRGPNREFRFKPLIWRYERLPANLDSALAARRSRLNVSSAPSISPIFLLGPIAKPCRSLSTIRPSC